MFTHSCPRLLFVSLFFSAFSTACVSNAPTPLTELALEPARVEINRKDYFGTELSDPYQWMEKKKNKEELDAWLLKQGAYTTQTLKKSKNRDQFYQRLKELNRSKVSVYGLKRVNGHTFYFYLDETSQSPKLMVKSLGEKPKVLVDPDKLKGENGAPAAINNFTPSHDGELVAYNLSFGGSELTDIHFIKTQTGEKLKDVLTWIWGEFAASWLPDNSGVTYTRMIRESKVNPAINKMHNMGVYGARSEARVFVADLDGITTGNPMWKKLANYSDAYNGNITAVDDLLYYQSTEGAPNSRILVRSLVDLNEAPIDSEGRSGLFRQSVDGAEVAEIELPYVGKLWLLDAPLGQAAFAFSLQGWTKPREYFEFLPDTNTIRTTGLKSKSVADLSDVEVVRAQATSHDGVKVPITIIHKKGLELNGTNPTIINGYGGYGLSHNPRFDGNLLAWLEKGGIQAYAHVRGGGEKGKQWHLDGKGINKENGVRDLVACARYLINQNYTSSAHLAAAGVSMGGVLVGRALTEEPDLFDAGIIAVGMLNVVRYLESDNGANQTSELTATPDSKKGFEILHAMDSYHNIKAGVKYPGIMLFHGLNDRRVPPWESAKFAAKMQAQTPSKVLLRIDENTGHGVGSTKDQRLQESADAWAFLLNQFEDLSD